MKKKDYPYVVNTLNNGYTFIYDNENHLIYIGNPGIKLPVFKEFSKLPPLAFEKYIEYNDNGEIIAFGQN